MRVTGIDVFLEGDPAVIVTASARKIEWEHLGVHLLLDRSLLQPEPPLVCFRVDREMLAKIERCWIGDRELAAIRHAVDSAEYSGGCGAVGRG